MRASLRRHYAQLITSGGQLALLLAGFYFESREAWRWILSLTAFISLLAWLAALHRKRLIVGTATSRITSAAQGYVELLGRAYPEGAPILGKYSLLPCLWYRYKVEKKNHKNEWRTVGSGESEAPFRLDDGSGVCVIDPAGAEIIARHKDTWQVGDERYTEWKLLEQDKIYVLGEFRTVGGSSVSLGHDDMVKQVLHEWKLDHAGLLKRFDLDGDGLLDMDEWLLARQAAKREARKRLNEARAEPDTHFMLQPRDGRLYLISNLSPEQLARRYALWSWLHLLVFFGALGGIAWLH